MLLLGRSDSGFESRRPDNLSNKFIKKIEDFLCKKCGCEVVGDGYTNHCPECLWSMHVDYYPGDREALCKGMMEPIGVIYEKNGYVLEHRCGKCGKQITNKVVAEDNMDSVLKLSKKLALSQEEKNPRLRR